jgi:spore coat protein A, manganese oxidase
MNESMLNRRDVLKISAFGAAALAIPLQQAARGLTVQRMPTSKLPAPYTVPFIKPPVAQRVRYDAATNTDYYRIVQAPAVAKILPGYNTPVFAYNGAVPGPTIVVPQNRRTVVRQINQLPGKHPILGYVPWTSTHLHGAASLPQYDGHASDRTFPGQGKDYVYDNTEPARTLWYHDHGEHHTAENVYFGLAGQYQLTDPQERALPIPKGTYDIPLTLSDAIFGIDGSLLFTQDSRHGLTGDVILVNARPWPVLKVERRKYRFRLLNASVGRGYRLALSTGVPMTVIATDGGLMPAPQQVNELRFGMGERYEVVIDFAQYKIGQRVELRNLGVPNTANYVNTDKVMAFDVTSNATSTANNSVPAQLNPDNLIMQLTPDMASIVRRFEVDREGDIWRIAGMSWDQVVDSGYTAIFANPQPYTAEIWEIENTSDGWFHPVHPHLIDFQILSRNGRPPRPEERGPKDVVYIGEGETVRLITYFGDPRGRYMIHCHHLIHEDHGMMTQFEIGEGGDDPFSVPARPLATMPPL